MEKTCPLTGKTFVVSEKEMQLRKKLGIEGEPQWHPVARWRHLGAFWQHWALHRRKCDKTGKQIISVFGEDCPYPVWHKDEWMKGTDPQGADFDPSRPVFEQLWDFFRRSPIPHNVGAGNQNCEYTDDLWYGKNCYLCHSGDQCEDLRYCYRTVRSRSCQFGVFFFDCEQCLDVISCHRCFRTLFSYTSWQCSDSAFLYDCRNCSNCLFCTNLRNKSYCIGNEQLTKEEYGKRRAEWDFRSRSVYEHAKKEFLRILKEQAWHRALYIDRSENATGNYLDECKNCENCFFLSGGVQDGINLFRVHTARDCVDCISPFKSELSFSCSLAQDNCYETKFCYNLIQCKYMEYSAHCFQCEHCFGCCGLVGKKYHIFNKPYAPEVYEKLRSKILSKMKETQEYGMFFPGHFAANPYQESLSGFYWPLTEEEGKKLGFRMHERSAERPREALDASEVPDRSPAPDGSGRDEADATLGKKVFWDDTAKRPFQIQEQDIAFAKDLGVPLPATYYMRRIQENFRLIPFDGELRDSVCGKCTKGVQTSWPSDYDGRILCEECYLKEVY